MTLVYLSSQMGLIFYFPLVTYQSVGGPKNRNEGGNFTVLFFPRDFGVKKKNRDKKRSLSNPKKYLFSIILV